MPLAPSELILNDDGSIYHLNLLPQDISDTILTVGDPDRVPKITKYFDSIEVSKQKREFFTQTGHLNGKRITVISTGIGTDNIDIVLNELDALVNIDFEIRQPKSDLKSLDIVRIGTSGAIQPEIDVDEFIVSEFAIGLDSLLHYYDYEPEHKEFEFHLDKSLDIKGNKTNPYIFSADSHLYKLFYTDRTISGITVTSDGFYGPQGRILRLNLTDNKLKDKLRDFKFKNKKITNMEMETAGIYGMAKLLGHRAISLNAILANRETGKFSKNPEETTNQLIQYALNILTNS